MNLDSGTDVYTLPYVKQLASRKLVSSIGISAWCCDDLEGWDGERGGRATRAGIYVYLWLIHLTVQKKVT